MAEIYVSVDIESDGPIPGPNSMLSFGAAAFIEGKGLISTFERNLETLPGAAGDPNTMQWWARPENATAWTAHRQNTIDPKQAMSEFVQWTSTLAGVELGGDGKPVNTVFVAYPAGFDFLFVYWYLIRFVGWSPFSFSALDIKSFAMGVLGTPYRKTTKKYMPREWFGKRPHTHVAIDDAIGQGELFMNALKASRESGRIGKPVR
jgi:hypothetical protein